MNDYNGYVHPSISDSTALGYLSGVGLQYAGGGMAAQIAQQAPKLKLWETETPCGSGKLNAAQRPDYSHEAAAKASRLLP